MVTASEHPQAQLRRSMRTLLAGVSVVILGAVLGAGCDHDNDDNAPFVEADPFEFIWDGNFDNYYNQEVYFWNTIYDEAVVEIDAYDFRGHLIVDIFDDTDTLVYSREFFGHGGELFLIDYTEFGFAGEWVIKITSTDVDGLVTLYVN